uniref:Uncharacterized protein n=1 Tax=Knipowitschia caucasica TaxID=637954 RepID=A0AAV2J6K8_KNICA
MWAAVVHSKHRVVFLRWDVGRVFEALRDVTALCSGGQERNQAPEIRSARSGLQTRVDVVKMSNYLRKLHRPQEAESRREEEPRVSVGKAEDPAHHNSTSELITGKRATAK